MYQYMILHTRYMNEYRSTCKLTEIGMFMHMYEYVQYSCSEYRYI